MNSEKYIGLYVHQATIQRIISDLPLLRRSDKVDHNLRLSEKQRVQYALWYFS